MPPNGTPKINRKTKTVMTPRKRETTVKYVKSPSQVTVASIYTLALELSRQADGTIGPEFKKNFDFSFDLLVEAQAKLADTQSQNDVVPKVVNYISEQIGI